MSNLVGEKSLRLPMALQCINRLRSQVAIESQKCNNPDHLEFPKYSRVSQASLVTSEWTALSDGPTRGAGNKCRSTGGCPSNEMFKIKNLVFTKPSFKFCQQSGGNQAVIKIRLYKS